MKHLSSTQNAAYKSIRRLARSSDLRRSEGTIVLDGVHLVRAYIERFGNREVELIIKQSAVQHPEIQALAQKTASMTLSDSLFDRAASVKSPLGILALAPFPKMPESLPGQGFQILIDGVQDPGNVGTILRSAAASGARTAHLSGDCADPWSPKCLRGGMGAQFILPVQQHKHLPVTAQSLGVRLIACVADAPTSVFDADLRGSVAFIIGAEGTGISEELLAIADQKIRIPMRSGIESLNVAAAAAVCFYEWARRVS